MNENPDKIIVESDLLPEVLLKVIEAKKLLETTDMSISEIAHMCGYIERNYFTNNFIKRYKISPALYRSKNRRK